MGKLSSSDEGLEALHVCTMAMEVALALCNYEVGEAGHGILGLW